MANERSPLTPDDLARVVYSAGKVFDGLSSTRLATEAFLHSDDTSGINSRRDLELLRDLKAVAELVIETSGSPITPDFVRALNGSMTRSAALHPGEFRRDDQRIGVNTPLGRHEPDAIDAEKLQTLITNATDTADPEEAAISLFIWLAKAQPFEDGNKRTALFAANAHLINEGTGTLLLIPHDDDDPLVSAAFIRALAVAYVQEDEQDVRLILRAQGLALLQPPTVGMRRTDCEIVTNEPPLDTQATVFSHPEQSPQFPTM